MVAARLMDEIERDFGEDAELETVAVVVSIADQDDIEHVRYSCEDDQPYRQVGLFSLAMDTAMSGKVVDD